MSNFKKKEEITYKLKKQFEQSLSVLVASMHGMNANSINQLRKEARNTEVDIKVVPNSLLRKAALKTSCECLLDVFVGHNIVAFSNVGPGDAARVFVQFAKNHENFKIKGAAFESKLIKSDQIDILADLPDYTESIIRLMLMLKMSSIGNLMRVLIKLSN